MLDRNASGPHNLGMTTISQGLLDSLLTISSTSGSYGIYRWSHSHYSIHVAHSTQVSVNSAIVSSTGGTCVCPTDDHCFMDSEYLLCVDQIRRELITTTAAISCLASILMGVFANLPVGLAPGLGLNTYVSDLWASAGIMNYELTLLISSLTPSSVFMGAARPHSEKHYQPHSWRVGSS